MADTPRRIADPAEFASVITLAASIHADTRQLYGMIAQERDRLGVRYPAGIVAAVSRLRSGATAMAYGSEAIAQASLSDAIDPRWIGRQPYGRKLLGPGDVPAWMVDFELQVVRGSASVTEWHHLRYTGSLPATMAALSEDIANYSELRAEGYGVSIGDLGTIRIGAI